MAQKPPNPAEAEQPKKRGKLLMIVSLLVVVLGAGGGAAWFFMKPADSAAQHAKAKPALFLPLEIFTANLQSDEGQPQFVQIGLTLKMNDADAIGMIKERMPEVRNRVLMVLSGKRAGELLPVPGKEKLATDIATAIQGVIAPLVAKAPAVPAEEEPAAEVADGGEVKAAPKAKSATKGPAIEVLFTSFMIQ